ncbi:MAG: hypothetical protein ACR2IV_10230 [Bryobacteraceae bacterium]
MHSRDWNKIGAIGQIVSNVIGVVTLILMLWLAYHPPQAQQVTGHPSTPVVWWMPVLIAATIIASAVLHYSAVKLSRGEKPTEQERVGQEASETLNSNKGTRSALNMTGGAISLLRTSGGPGGARLIDMNTTGGGEQELNLEMRPTKILFEQSRDIVDINGFGTKVILGGKSLTVRRFTDKGVVVDDHGAMIHVRIYVLDGSPSS